MPGKATITDVMILGAGPAGISAAVWCRELGLSFLLTDPSGRAGGQLHSIHNPITNYPGAIASDGQEMLEKFQLNLAEQEIEVLAAGCTSVDLTAFTAETADGQRLAGRAIVIATGVRRRMLNITGEMEFAGRGVLDSGVRARLEMAGKRVLIVGGGDAAIENALILREKAEHITIVHRRDRFTARAEFVDSLAACTNVSIVLDAELRSIAGNETVTAAVIEKEGRSLPIAVDAVLVRIGVEPNSELFRSQIEVDEQGYVVVDSACRTSLANVFAAGDVANAISPTIATAMGMGATAAKACYAALRPL